jgi:hypothetical protein
MIKNILIIKQLSHKRVITCIECTCFEKINYVIGSEFTSFKKAVPCSFSESSFFKKIKKPLIGKLRILLLYTGTNFAQPMMVAFFLGTDCRGQKFKRKEPIPTKLLLPQKQWLVLSQSFDSYSDSNLNDSLSL